MFGLMTLQIVCDMRKIKEGISPFYQEVFSHFSRKTNIPLETLMKLEFAGCLKLPPMIDFVLDDAFFEEVKFGKGSVEVRLKTVGDKFKVAPWRVKNAVQRMGHELPSKAL